MIKKRRKAREFGPGAVAYACLIYLFLYLPIFVVIAFSFNSSKMNIVFEHFTVEWYFKMFDNRQLMQSFVNTIIVAGISTVLSVIIGTLCALGLYKFEFRLKNVISSSLYIPIVIPELVFAIALLAFFSSLNIPMSMATLVIAHVTFSMPFVVITVRARLAAGEHHPSFKNPWHGAKGRVAGCERALYLDDCGNHCHFADLEFYPGKAGKEIVEAVCRFEMISPLAFLSKPRYNISDI